MKPAVAQSQGGQHEQVQRGGGHQPAQDDDGHGTFDFPAGVADAAGRSRTTTCGVPGGD